LRVVIGGASGFLGSALVQRLRSHGHEVVRLVRRDDPSADTSRWDPAAGVVDQSAIDSADAIVNLSGEPIAHWPPTESWRRELVTSRISATTTLARAVAAAPSPPVLISGSASGYYGPDRGDELLTENSPPGAGFLSELVVEWEKAASAAMDAGSRVVFLRTGLPAHRSGGLLKPLLPGVRLGLGAAIGSGKQYFPVVSLTDWCRAVLHALDGDFAGPINIAMPDVPTNAEFMDALGRATHRPRFLRVPQTAVKLGLGSMAPDILGSIRLSPQRLLETGFEFAHPTLEDVVAAALNANA
jgi:uncharacterized protein (TIGR01777 family)